jgi:hypothetical protein
MRFKKNTRSRTLKRFKKIYNINPTVIKSNTIQSVIKNPELDKHRAFFLGVPGSKKWNEYHDELMHMKRQIFNEESIAEKNDQNDIL